MTTLSGESTTIVDGATNAARVLTSTLFPSVDCAEGERQSGTLAELLDELRVPHFDASTAKESLPLWAPASFANDKRNTKNVEAVWAVGFDVDEVAEDKPVPSADSLRALKHLGFFHCSSRHTPSSPRWRLFLVLSRNVNASEYKRVWRAVKALLPFRVTVGDQSSDACRQWFVPRAPAEGEYVFHELHGAPIDVDAMLLAEPERPSDGIVQVSPHEAEGTCTPEPSSLVAAALVLAPAFVDGKRHAIARATSGWLCLRGVSRDDATTFLCTMAKAGPMGNEDADERRKTVDATFDAEARGQCIEGFPTLENLVGDRARLASEVLFQRPRWFENFYAWLQRRGERQQANDVSAEDNPLRIEYGGLDAEPPSVEYVVDGILPVASVGMFAAEPYALKTWGALDIASCVARGVPWLGKYPVKKGRALVIDYEMGMAKVKRRLQLLGDDGSVGRTSHPDFEIGDEKFWTALEKLKPSLVVVDSFSAGNPGVEEKDTRAAIPLKLAARFAAATKCSFIFIHHTTKDRTAGKKNSIRGSGAIFAALDVCFVFEPMPGCPKKEPRAKIECIKMREGEEPEPFAIKLTDERGLELYEEQATTNGAPKGPDLVSQIKLRLSYGPTTARELAMQMQKRPAAISEALLALKERGEACQFERKWRSDSDKKREERVLAAIDAPQTFYSSAKELAEVAHVSVEDLRILERNEIILRTSGVGHFARGPKAP